VSRVAVLLYSLVALLSLTGGVAAWIFPQIAPELFLGAMAGIWKFMIPLFGLVIVARLARSRGRAEING
jgi:hypothetical protein